MKVRDIMTPGPIVVHETTPLQDVARVMIEHRIGCVPVVNAADTLCGIIAESDFISNEGGAPFSFLLPRLVGLEATQDSLETLRQEARGFRASNIMSAPVVTVGEDETLAILVGRLMERSLKRLPVTRDGRVVGIVSRHDLLRLLLPSPAGNATTALT